MKKWLLPIVGAFALLITTFACLAQRQVLAYDSIDRMQASEIGSDFPTPYVVVLINGEWTEWRWFVGDSTPANGTNVLVSTSRRGVLGRWKLMTSGSSSGGGTVTSDAVWTNNFGQVQLADDSAYAVMIHNTTNMNFRTGVTNVNGSENWFESNGDIAGSRNTAIYVYNSVTGEISEFQITQTADDLNAIWKRNQQVMIGISPYNNNDALLYLNSKTNAFDPFLIQTNDITVLRVDKGGDTFVGRSLTVTNDLTLSGPDPVLTFHDNSGGDQFLTISPDTGFWSFQQVGSTIPYHYRFHSLNGSVLMTLDNSVNLAIGESAPNVQSDNGIAYKGVLTTESVNEVPVAAVGLLGDRTLKRLTPASPVTMTAVPTIDASYEVDGVHLSFIGSSDVNTVTMQDEGALPGSKLQLQAATRVLGKGDILKLVWIAADGFWYEEGFFNN